jgi:hypothetical protein
MQATCVEREPVVEAVARQMADRLQHASSGAPITLADMVHHNVTDGWTFELPDGGAGQPLHAEGLHLHDADLMRAWTRAQQLASVPTYRLAS